MTATPAFDPTAHAYDAEFTDQLLGKWLREQVWIHTPFTAPMTILELGCGTGEDARHFADMGISVLATDASGEMIAVARAKNANLTPRPPLQSGEGAKPDDNKGMIYHAPTIPPSDSNSSPIPPLHEMGRGLGGG
ncbi:MAG TPA: class I SAM-dependent methyltransferase, partial [Aggregatilineales bacterium]|nr:class I SAM-dependent methyltransferase [Aggregatilineales bacterium]